MVLALRQDPSGAAAGVNIVALTLSYPPVRRVGAELALHALLCHLKTRGHSAQVVTTQPVKRTTVDGVHVAAAAATHRPQGDVVVVNAGLAAKARQWWPRAPMVVWAHNNQVPSLLDVRSVMGKGTTRLMANTRHMRDVFRSVLGVESLVLHPPVHPGVPGDHGQAITLINLTAEKGAGVFWSLAQANPDRQFLAVKGGYGNQDIRDLPNVEVVPHGDLEAVWPRTGILLVPSVHESYSMAAVEAATRGIPAIASDLPGVREALGHGARYVTRDWQSALDDVTTHWDDYSTDALIHQACTNQPAELDRAADLIEGLSA